MATVTTWTGREANALANPATPQVAATHVHTGEGSIHDIDLDGDVRRRDLLTGVTISGMALPNVAALLNALVAPPISSTKAAALPLRQFTRAVAATKSDYQACRYEQVLTALVALLPTLEPTRAETEGEQRAQVDARASDLYHVIGSVLLKVGDKGMALVAAERSTRAASISQDPVTIAASARIMTHALMSNGHSRQARQLAEDAAETLRRGTRLASTDAVAVYGALLLRGAVAAARDDNRDSAQAMLDEASHAAGRLGCDGNERWTGFGATNVLLHHVNIALTLGDAGTAITLARQVPLDEIDLAERKASLFVDVARAYTQWGRYEPGLNALRRAYEVAPQEIRCRPAVQGIASDLEAARKRTPPRHLAARPTQPRQPRARSAWTSTRSAWDSWHRFTTLALAICAADATDDDPTDIGLIKLTVNEIPRLINASIIRPINDLAHRLHWSGWRRRHQARARQAHYTSGLNLKLQP